jgi:hypothetical protein
MTAEFNAEQFTRELCQNLNLEVCGSFRAGSFDFPEGWKSVVARMLTAMRDRKVQIFAIRNDHGLLDVRAVAEPESELRVYRAILVYQQWASIACDNCGARGRKMILGGKVRVLCPGCMDKNKED